MSKTIAQKLSSATKKLKQADRNDKAADHYIAVLRKELEIKQAQLRSAETFIEYLQFKNAFSGNVMPEDIDAITTEIPYDELAKFHVLYETRWQLDKEKNVIEVRTIRKEVKE